MNKRVLISIILLVVIVGLLGVLTVIPQPAKPVSPTPTPTKAPVSTVNVMGGQVFLANQKVVDHIFNTYNIQVKYTRFGSGQMVAAKKEETDKYDCAFPGSAVTLDEFIEAHPGLVKWKEVVFRTPGNFFTWREYYEEMKKAGLVYENNGAFIKLKPIVAGINAGKKWADIGAPGIPGSIKIVGSDPLTSGGGLTLYELFATYMVGGDELDEPIRMSQLDKKVLDSLVSLWDRSGFQSKESPEAFEDFLKGGRRPLGWSSESLFLSWYTSGDEKVRKQSSEIIGLYPEPTIMTDHTLACWTPNGQRLVEIFTKDKVLQQLGWDDHGMRTKVADIDAKAGDTDIWWVVKDLRRVITEPKPEVGKKIKEEIKAYRTQSQ